MIHTARATGLPGVYLVYRRPVDGPDVTLGYVFPVYGESHIRRGRLRTTPEWRAERLDGTRIVVNGMSTWYSRRAAIAALEEANR